MIHSPRRRARHLGDWLTGHPFVLPAIVIFAGALFRFYNLNWDSGLLLHPDERWIYEVVTGASPNPPISWPSSIAQFFDVAPTGGSPLNPHFFAYGSLPFYLLAFVAGTVSFLGRHIGFLSSWAGVDSYSGLASIGRPLSGIFDLAATFVLFLIGRRVFGYWTGVLAMALGAFTVLDIQLSHFYTVDTVLLPLVLLTLLAAVHIAQTGSRAAYIWGGIALGAALATKTTALVLIAPLGAAGVAQAYFACPEPAPAPILPWLRAKYARAAARLNRNLLWTLVAFLIAALTFCVFEPYAVLDRAQLIHDIAEQNTYLVSNNPPFVVPYTIQYAHDTPYVYQIANLLFWDLGLPLGLAAFAGVLFALFRVWRKPNPALITLLVWVIPYFLFVGTFFAKFSRYMLPIVPIIILFGAALLIEAIRRFRRAGRAIAIGALVAVLGGAFLYSVAYMNIYAHLNTRVAASEWIYTHIPPHTAIATEGAWDDTLPMPLLGYSPAEYAQPQPALNLYDPDSETKAVQIAQVLEQSRYLTMSSQRMIGSIPKLPDRYPITTRYYRLLFAGKLGYRLVAHFQQHPRLGPIVVHDYSADESFHVYDHPNVRIFKRVRTLGVTHIVHLLTAGMSPAALSGSPAPTPHPSLTLTPQQWQADQQGPTYDSMFPPNGLAMHIPILVWWLALEMLGLIALPLCFVLFGGLIDRGVVIAKLIGLLTVGYLVWIAVSLHLVTYSLSTILAIVALTAIVSAVAWWRMWREIVSFFRTHARVILAAELVFLAGFAAFLALRAWYPDLGHQFSPVSPTNAGDGRMGEKQMEMAYINGIVRSRVFPPLDPYYAHGFINYYYYGFYLVATLCKLTQIVPTTGFNLAIAMFFALLVTGVFSVGLNLTRRLLPGLIAAIFVGAIGNLAGALQVIQGLMTVATFHSTFPFFGGIADIADGAFQVVVQGRQLPPFDFWTPTRIIPPTGAVISEFPYFTYLFADLHPHLIAYPMTAAALALAVSLAVGTRPRTYGQIAVTVAGAALILGALIVTNPWDFPTYLIVVGLGALIGMTWRARSWRALAEPLGGIVLVAALSFLLYLPFERSYRTVFSTGIGLVRTITPAMLSSICPSGQTSCPGLVHDALVTPLPIYLEHFGLFYFAVVSYLIVLAVRAWPGSGHHVDRTATALALGGAVLVAGLAILDYWTLAFLFAVGTAVGWIVLQHGYRLERRQTLIFGLILIPIGLSIVTQVVFVKDWLAGGAFFRMNTIFKFYNQAWVMLAIAAACALYFFMTEQVGRGMAAFGRRTVDAATPTWDGSSGDALTMGEVDGRAQIASTAFAVSGDGSVVGPLIPPAPFSQSGRRGRKEPLQNIPPRPEWERGLGGEGTPSLTPSRRHPWSRILALVDRRPFWSIALAGLIIGSFIYTYAGTVARETYRETWLPESSVPFTLDGAAYLKVAYPGDARAIAWLNANVRGAPVIAEANPNGYIYNAYARVAEFTGLPDILNGYHEDEQRYTTDFTQRTAAINTLYDSSQPSAAWQVIHRYGVRYIFVGWLEKHCTVEPPNKIVTCYPKSGLAKFNRMVGNGLQVAYRRDGVTIYEVTR